MPTATHVLILFSGRCEAGTGCFGFSIRGLNGPLEPIAGCGVLAPPEKGPMSSEYAAYTALGRALALCVASYRASFTPETQLTICTDCRGVVDQFGGKEVPAEHLAPLMDAVKEKVSLLGCKRSLQWIPQSQNVEADMLAKAAYVGRTGKPIPTPQVK